MEEKYYGNYCIAIEFWNKWNVSPESFLFLNSNLRDYQICCIKKSKHPLCKSSLVSD